MNTTQAQTLIRDAFTQKFDRDRFRQFVRELLNTLDESKAHQTNQAYIKDAFKPGIERAERLGKYTDPEGQPLDVYIVYLKREISLERARTLQRNFVVDVLETRGSTDAALVAFVPPSGADWRFSFIKLDYAAHESDGQVTTKRVLKSARRFSFLVGAGENSHTAQAQLVGMLADSTRNPTLAEVELAFSVERVTDEFFESYKALYVTTKAALDNLLERNKPLALTWASQRITTEDFAKKLLGQIVFLYFLQKKGWLGVARGSNWGSGPRHFLRGLFDETQRTGKNFFNEVLEPLFYDTLATDRGDEAWCAPFNCRIPFLNGGLFEPLHSYDWRNTHINLPNTLFSAFIPGPSTVTTREEGNGILDVFDLYNFTVNEDEPLEKEVAIDPEMLGKVFENLLNPTERKKRGAVYTPREIVHYMCQQSLIFYLDGLLNLREQSLLDLTRTVPEQPILLAQDQPAQAVLSALGRDEQISLADLTDFIEHCDRYAHYAEAMANGTQGDSYPKPPASIRQQAAALDEALRDITVCDPAIGSGAFPVGMMTEIVRARLALSPYLSSPATNGVNGLDSRTAYAFKRHAIQTCIYGVDVDAGAVEIAKLRLWLSLVVDEQSGAQIAPLPNLDYKVMCGNALIGLQDMGFGKLPKVEELTELKRAFFGATNPSHKAQLRTQIDDSLRGILEGLKKKKSKEALDIEFDFRLHFAEVFANKNGFDVVIGNPPYVRHEAIKEFKPALQSRYDCYTGTADLYVYFYERGLRLLRSGGLLAFITSNKYFRAGYGKKLRGFLSDNTTLRRLIDFGDAPVFEAIAYPSILIATRQHEANPGLTALAWQPDWALSEFAARRTRDSFDMPQHELTQEGWRLGVPATLRLLDKLRAAGKPLGEFVNGKLYYGIKTGLNEAFVVDRATRDRLIAEHESSAELLKPFLRGRDVKRWVMQPQDLWLIFTRRGTVINKYPAIKKHLTQFKAQLMPGVPGGRKPGSYEWFEIQDNIAYWQEFEQPKIIYPNICSRNEFAWDESGFYANQKTFIISGASKYLLGILNSSVVLWLFDQLLAKLQGGFYEPSSIFMRHFPIPAATHAQQSAITALVARILAAKRANASADVSAWEREIDEVVYGLYRLSAEEIAIVEGSD